MRYLAIGDIHGYSEVLHRLLEVVEPAPDDQIITLGDYVDRGPNSRGRLPPMRRPRSHSRDRVREIRQRQPTY